MGNTHSNSNARMAGIGNLVAEVGNDIQYDKGIGNSRFLRAVRARHRLGPIVVKTFVKPDPSMSLKSLVKHIRIERESLADVPNVLTYQKVVETERAGYLIRQWLHSNLYDRISTRPFLSSIEKRWITYQLLHAMRDTHERGIAHGDLKCENILVTASLMVYVTDFASSFKPTYLPLDDPSDFSFFFDTSGRRTCYLAPERFYEAGSKYASGDTRAGTGDGDAFDRIGGFKADLLGMGRQSGKVNQSMDVFSLGCVIAELWREGAPTFTLSQLFKYREGMFDVHAMLAGITDDSVRALVRSMVSLDPADRKTFEQYLTDSRGTVFPATIPDFFHEYLVELQRTSPTALNPNNNNSGVSSIDSAASGSNASVTAVSMRSEATSRQAQRTESDERVEKLYEEWSSIVKLFDDPTDRTGASSPSTGPSGVATRLDGVLGRFAFQSSFQKPPEAEAADVERSTADELDDVFPVHLSIPGIPPSQALLDGAGAEVDGTAQLVLSVILANLRNCIRPSSKCHALELLVHLSTRWLTDETKLDRVLPYVMSLFDDLSSQVRMAAIRSCVQTLLLVRIVTPSNASIFPEYIMPNIKQLGLDPSTPVRCTFAASIVPLAETAERFLQMSQAMRAEGLFAVESDLNGGFIDGQPNESNYDEQLRTFQALLQEIIVTLLTDPSASVKRALLGSIAPLCRFFGMAKTNDVMLSHMITYLNDRNWLLREAFFDIIVDVAEVSGNRSLEEYILPLMTQALSDSEENVVYRVIKGLRTMTERGLLDRARLLSLLDTTIGFLCHPDLWLRQASAGLIAAAAAKLEDVDVWAILYPSLRPLLRSDVQDLTEITLLDMAKAPLTRPVFAAALGWASQASNSAFWKGSVDGKDQAGLKNGLATEGVGLLLGKSGRDLIIPSRGRTEEDDRFRDKLRSMGMEDDDEVKLVALRSIIRRLSKQGSKIISGHVDWDVSSPEDSAGAHSADSGRAHPKAVIEPQSLDGITPQTIFFSTKVDQRPVPAASEGASTYTGTFRSQDDASFSAQVAKRRLLGHRTSSESSFASPIADIRRRMTSTSIADPQPSTFSTRLSSLAEEHAQERERDSAAPAPSSPLSQQTQARLGVGKATAAVASTALTAIGMMTEASARARAQHAAAAQASNKPTPTGSRTSTVLGAGGADDAGKLGAAAGVDGGSSAGFTSTYDGNDPYIRAHLEAMYLDSFRDRPELGPKIHAGVARRKGGAPWNRSSALPRAPTSSTSKRRPEGRLIAYFTEHSAAITCLALSPDHAYFVSGSQDGTLKVWDTARLEKNVTSKSRATYSAQKGAITGVIAIEGSHCVASIATDGSLHVWRIDMIQSTSSVPRYGRPKLVSNFQLSTPDEYATCLVQSSTETSSHLILGTTLSRLTILDLRTMQVLQTLRNPVEYGPITCLCVDRKKAWLLVGTLTGVVCLWDLRFGLRLRAWHVGASEIGSLHRVNQIAIHPSKGRGRWVLIAFENRGKAPSQGQGSGADQPEVIVETWDIDRGIRVETFEAQKDSSQAPMEADRSTKLRQVQDEVDARAGGLSDSGSSNRTMSGNAKIRHDSMLTGAAAAIERLLQQQQQQIQGLSSEGTQAAVEDDPFDSGPATGATARLQSGIASGAEVQSCSVKALFVSLEGYSSSSLSAAAAAAAAAAAKPSNATTQEDAAEGGVDGTDTIHAETGGGWLDVGKLTRATDRMSVSSLLSQNPPASTAAPSAPILSNGGGSGPGGYMITAGSDGRLRFWDLGKPEKSLVFGVQPRVLPQSSASSSLGRPQSTLGAGALVSVEPRSEFRCLHPTAPGTPARVVHTMWFGDQAEEEQRGLAGTRLKSPLLANQTAVYAGMSRAHKDAVTDVLVIESPFRCVVAADRSGCIRVWE
ncbi:related to VPS15 - ser/thr protein kinase [Ustilago sp. UG-2017b]|nr:related to VPS15 - ser/thr protein kinase [Ustilago sp. UG-2017b]